MQLAGETASLLTFRNVIAVVSMPTGNFDAYVDTLDELSEQGALEIFPFTTIMVEQLFTESDAFRACPTRQSGIMDMVVGDAVPGVVQTRGRQATSPLSLAPRTSPRRSKCSPTPQEPTQPGEPPNLRHLECET